MKAFKHVQWGSIAVPVDRLGFLDRIFIMTSLVGVLIWAFPHLAVAQSMQEMPLRFEINNIPLIKPHEDFFALAMAGDVLPEPVDPRIELLSEYLRGKKSPMADHAALLLKQYNFRLIIGISFAESNFCKYQIMPNNCWGIGGSNPERYPTLADGIIRANGLIQKYIDNGMTTPKLMRNTWVGWPNHNWPIAVEQITKELEDRNL